MAPVLRLVKSSNRQTIELFEGLSELARLEEVDDVIVCYRKRGRPMSIATTGTYRINPAEALRAVMKAKAHLTQIDDQIREVP